MTESSPRGPLAALSWPGEWANPSDLQRFLIGMPLIGLQHRVYKTLSAHLLSRGPDYHVAWSASPVPDAVWTTWSRNVMDAGLWPSDKFIPNDPFGIVFWDHRFDSLGGDELLARLADAFRFDPKRVAWSKYREASYETVLADLSRGNLGGP